MFPEDFLSGTVAEDFPVHGVDGPCHDIAILLRPMGQGFTLTEVTANQAVGVLITATFRRTEGMAIVNRQRKRIGSGELSAVIYGDTLERTFNRTSPSRSEFCRSRSYRRYRSLPASARWT